MSCKIDIIEKNVSDKKFQRDYVPVMDDAKFKGKLTSDLKNDIRNLVNFNASSGKSENFHFDVLLFIIIYMKFQLKKYRRVISHDTEEWSKL